MKKNKNLTKKNANPKKRYLRELSLARMETNVTFRYFKSLKKTYLM